MTSGSGQSDERRSPSSVSSQRRVRHCRALFVLGSGADPSDVADAFADRYRRSRSPDELDFSAAEQIVGIAADWSNEGKSGYRTAALEYVRQWCESNAVPLDDKLVLVRRFTTDDGRLLAVAGYFPDQQAQVETVTESPQSETPAESVDNDESPFATTVRRLTEFVQRIPPTYLTTAAGSAAVILILYLAGSALFSGGGNGDGPADGRPSLADTDESDTSGSESADREPRLAPPQFLTGVLRVYTAAPGFGVLIDGNVVLDSAGAPVVTPCAVTVEQGSRSVTVFREGWHDLAQQVDVGEDSDVTLSPSEDSVGAGSDYLRAPHRAAKAGQPIALESLNSPRAEFDPFITPDGLSIWFAGDRPDGRGIFVATRPSPWHDFAPPEMVQTSADLPASPSVTSDGLSVVYAVPKKARLLSMTRDNPLSPFSNWQPLANHDSLMPNWLSAQILGDGKRLYWVEENRGELKTYAAKRDSIYDDFGKRYVVALPGIHPHMTQDGLRQYEFDGHKLTRYRRTSTAKRFVPDRVIAELTLNAFHSAPKFRQFAVSGDEQWMFYCDDPDGAANLYMVRLAETPQWGVAPLGKQIAPKMEIAAAEMQEPEEVKPVKPEPEPVDPRSLPLAYEAHWTAFSKLVGQRQYDAAAGLLVNAKTNPAIESFTEPLGWDVEDLRSIREFWSSLEQGLKQIKPGTMLRVGTRRSEFVAVEAGELVTKQRDQEIRKALTSFDASELSTLFDEVFEKTDEDAQYNFAVLLAYDASSLDRLRERRAEQAGARAIRFQERLAQRQLRLARAELNRSNFAQGMRLLKEAKVLAGDTAVSADARQLEEQLYSYIKWQPRGPRKWQINDNEFAAAAERLPGSLLVSDQKYQNFQLSLEWKTQDLATAQGGVYFRYDGGNDFNNGAFKIHLANDAGGAVDQYSTGSLFTDTPPDANATKPAGEWNTLEILVRGDVVEATINGRKVLTATAQSDTLSQRGLIALDGVNGGITYRKVLISELPAK
ncbi:DUF1080 domain-containing protein [bacterium]|nr:DUF1080 domain-containing protein [bacterium]